MEIQKTSVKDFQILKNLNNFIRSGQNRHKAQDPDADQQKEPVEQIEKKPLEYKQTRDETERKKYQKKQKTKKMRNTRVQKQNAIICDNIIQKFFDLDPVKFQACLERMYKWDFQTTMSQFIINYYLFVKNDNRLRQYIVIHLKTLITMLKDRLQDDLYDSFQTFNFTNGKQYEQLQLLKNELRNKQKALSLIRSQGFRQDMPIRQVDIPLLSNDQAKDLRYQILNQLKAKNERLQEPI